MDKKLYSVMKVSILVFCVLLAIMAIFLLFPRKYTYSDGGTVVYESFGFGAIYTIEQRHCYTSVLDENGYAYSEKGTVITVFGVEVYNNAEIDYNDVAIAPHDPR